MRGIHEKSRQISISRGMTSKEVIVNAIIPCIFPCCREFFAEKGSLKTGPTASQIEMGPLAPFLFDQ